MRFTETIAVLLLASGSANALIERQYGGGGGGYSGGSGSGNGNGNSGYGNSGAGSSSSSVVVTSTLAVSYAASSTISVASSVSSSASTASSTGTACNNSPDLCDRNYNNITHFGAHDAAFLRDASTDYTDSGNQFYNATIALSAGVRLLQAQVHNSSGTLELCHTSCSLLDAGSLESWLSDIKSWMDDNTNDVVTILLVNSDDLDASEFGAVFESSGIADYGYTPSSTTGPISTWPTLRTLISANTRLVSFIASITYDSSYPYLMNEFDYMFETAYEVTSLSGFNCTLDRPTTLSSASDAISSGYMPFMNHFADTLEAFSIEIPDIDDIETTNSPDAGTTGALGTTVDSCESEWGQAPTFIMVDFWNVGPAIDAIDSLNGITAEGRTSVSTAELSAATSAAMKVGAESLHPTSLAAIALGAIGVMNFLFL